MKPFFKVKPHIGHEYQIRLFYLVLLYQTREWNERKESLRELKTVIALMIIKTVFGLPSSL